MIKGRPVLVVAVLLGIGTTDQLEAQLPPVPAWIHQFSAGDGSSKKIEAFQKQPKDPELILVSPQLYYVL